MRVVVSGGTGLIGPRLVTVSRRQGQEVLAASPDSGVDTRTGEELAGALTRAQVVVDVTNSPSFEDAAVMAFFETSEQRI
jgi:uncharacterized protein YbjT (DUF2867 family)